MCPVQRVPMYVEVAIEQGTTRTWYGRCIEFPGTIAWGGENQELLEELEREVYYHMDWLGNHQEQVPVCNEMALVVAEEVHNVPGLGESGGEVALFHYDMTPVTPEDLQYFVTLMSYNRDDLLTIVQDLPEDQLTMKPEGKLRSITDILHHICNAEEFYLSRMGPEAHTLYEIHAGLPVEAVDSLPVFQRLQTVRTASCKTLQDMIPQLGNIILTEEAYTAHPHEKWTARKVMRRFLEHEREHIYNIREYLGTPIRSKSL